MDKYTTEMVGSDRESEPAKPSSLKRAGSVLTATHQCCRCKNKHAESERVMKRTGPGAWSSRCPRCNGESYYDLTKEALNDKLTNPAAE